MGRSVTSSPKPHGSVRIPQSTAWQGARVLPPRERYVSMLGILPSRAHALVWGPCSCKQAWPWEGAQCPAAPLLWASHDLPLGPGVHVS